MLPGPDRDGRMVAVEFHVADIALHDRMLPLLKAPEPFIAVSGLMGLDIRLGYHVNAVFVAKVVPEMMIGIMTGSDGTV